MKNIGFMCVVALIFEFPLKVKLKQLNTRNLLKCPQNSSINSNINKRVNR